MMFFYQVSLPHYNDPKFLAQASIRYMHNFLGLRTTDDGHTQAWVPTYDIDLIWHTHMLHPISYYEDTIRRCNHMPPHNDAMNDRVEGGELKSDGKPQWKNGSACIQTTYSCSVLAVCGVQIPTIPSIYNAPSLIRRFRVLWMNPQLWQTVTSKIQISMLTI